MNKNKISIRLKNLIEEYIKNNIYNYILVVLVFIIGIVAGIITINNFSSEKKEIIYNYITAFLEKFYNTNNLEQNKVFVIAIIHNLIITIILCIAGTTILGIPIVLSVMVYKGFCLSYTISALTLSIGFNKSILFCFVALFLPNLLCIPALFTIAVSSLKLYKLIVSEKNRNIIKNRLLRHFIITILMFLILVFASIIESKLSFLILKLVKNYIM